MLWCHSNLEGIAKGTPEVSRASGWFAHETISIKPKHEMYAILANLGDVAVSRITFTVEREELRVQIECVFDAPRERVFRAFTDRDSIPHWWGPRGFETVVDKMDLREGGRWRFLNVDLEGNTYAFHGVYKRIDAPNLVSQTFNYEGDPRGYEQVETATFEDLDGKTKVTATAVYKVVAALDAALATGMEIGAIETWERLLVYVESNMSD